MGRCISSTYMLGLLITLFSSHAIEKNPNVLVTAEGITETASVSAATGITEITSHGTSSSSSLSPPFYMPPPVSPPRVYPLHDNENKTVSLRDGSWNVTVARGSLAWPNVNEATPPASFTVLESLLSKDEVNSILEIVRDTNLAFDEDSDSVDSMTTHEFYLESGGGIDPLSKIPGKPDMNGRIFEERKPYRDRLQAITRPFMESRILPFINENIASCGGSGRSGGSNSDSLATGSNAMNHVENSSVPTTTSSSSSSALGKIAVGNARNGVGCSVCQSLVRRYRDGERLSHATHFDVQALVTVVVSLSSYNVDYTGGLFLTTGATQQQGGSGGELFFGLQAGDAVIHQSDLLHGVKVFPPSPPPQDEEQFHENTKNSDKSRDKFPSTHIPRSPERWSWIMWLKDGTDCSKPDVHSWALEGAENGNAVAQFLQARRSSSSRHEKMSWLRKSARNGLARAANELAMELLDNNPGLLIASPEEEEVKQSSSKKMKKQQPQKVEKEEEEKKTDAPSTTTVTTTTRTTAAITKEDFTSKSNQTQRIMEAEHWLLIAASKYEPDALYNLGVRSLAKNQETLALEYFNKAVHAGSTDAAFNMGVAYYNGRGGVAKNLTAALHLLEVMLHHCYSFNSLQSCRW